MKLQKNSKILAIGAHLDDIEIACGGMLSKAIKNDHKVKMLVMTNSHNIDNAIRLQETYNSQKILKVKDLQLLNFKDTYIPYNGDSVNEINEVINSFHPDLVLTHWVFDTHQDHRNTSLATVSACRCHNNILMYEPIHPSGKSYVAFRPQIYSDISNNINIKIKALKKYKSQYQKYGKNWIEAIKGRAKLRGFESNCDYAEVFEVVRMEMKI